MSDAGLSNGSILALAMTVFGCGLITGVLLEKHPAEPVTQEAEDHPARADVAALRAENEGLEKRVDMIERRLQSVEGR